ncbi:MAG: A/G-specific adenine glycosylase [Phycisphaeraceae bacterium]|nr:A/G-specific adenine glycosylase [Phycisphaeraceae bacterium]
MKPARPRERSAKNLENRSVSREVESWFLRAARPLPWRRSPRDPYHAFISESMLQQTQVSRVVDRFTEFVGRYPTVEDLAAADEQDVLALWSGLGYYRRARNLLAAARVIAREHSGRIPPRMQDLLRLPGVGRYTAGAIASIGLGQRVPIVDGNVSRVLLRLHGKAADPSKRATVEWTWKAAEGLVAAAGDPALLNEGLMELGATVCTPKSPACGGCPLADWCVARQQGVTGEIPRPKRRLADSEKTVVRCLSAVIVDPESTRVLVERRATSGLWAGLWQVPTLESTGVRPTRVALARSLGVRLQAVGVRPMARLEHHTSHRLINVAVYRVDHNATFGEPRRWLGIGEALRLPLSSLQAEILRMANRVLEELAERPAVT